MIKLVIKKALSLFLMYSLLMKSHSLGIYFHLHSFQIILFPKFALICWQGIELGCVFFSSVLRLLGGEYSNCY